MTILELLVEDMEETLFAEGSAPLHEFSWTLRGMERGLTEDEIADLARQGYDALNARFRLHLEWFDWPPEDGRPAGSDASISFDTHRDFENTELAVPFLALVPDDPEAVAAELEKQFYPDGRPTPSRRWWQRR